MVTRSDRGILPAPLSIEEALSLVDDWLNHPHARILNPTDRHAALLARLLIGAGRGGNLVADVHLAAIAIEHGATHGSFDHDFERPRIRCKRKTEAIDKVLAQNQTGL
ncbi:MAG TPA: PIN domain-containing protein [Oleiagrimonas sp.]|nr:PIN domain-containing protein [Oleiagrimonas sp.]